MPNLDGSFTSGARAKAHAGDHCSRQGAPELQPRAHQGQTGGRDRGCSAPSRKRPPHTPLALPRTWLITGSPFLAWPWGWVDRLDHTPAPPQARAEGQGRPRKPMDTPAHSHVHQHRPGLGLEGLGSTQTTVDRAQVGRRLPWCECPKWPSGQRRSSLPGPRLSLLCTLPSPAAAPDSLLSLSLWSTRSPACPPTSARPPTTVHLSAHLHILCPPSSVPLPTSVHLTLCSYVHLPIHPPVHHHLSICLPTLLCPPAPSLLCFAPPCPSALPLALPDPLHLPLSWRPWPCTPCAFLCPAGYHADSVHCTQSNAPTSSVSRAQSPVDPPVLGPQAARGTLPVSAAPPVPLPGVSSLQACRAAVLALR